MGNGPSVSFGREENDRERLALWPESAYITSKRFWIGTFQTEETFTAGMVAGLPIERWQDHPDVDALSRQLSTSGHAHALLQVQHTPRTREGCQARLFCWGMPAPIRVRGGVIEPLHSTPTLVLRSGDYLVLIENAYLIATGQDWQQIATSIRRWTETGCDATQLLDCLLRTRQRLARSRGVAADTQQAAILTVYVRPRVSATVWTGPPGVAELDRVALELLMGEAGLRIICGDTTARIAAGLLGRPLYMNQSDLKYHSEVPPISHLEGVDLVTEGLVTLGHAKGWLQGARTVRDLPRRVNAATRLAYALLSADCIHFLVGQAINPVQVDATDPKTPQRMPLVEEIAALLRSRGKLVRISKL